MHVDNKKMFNMAGVATGIACGIVLGWILRGKCGTYIYRLAGTLQKKKSFEENNKTNNGEMQDMLLADNGEYKLVLIIRKDLNMGKGKAAAQCCHATADIIKKLIIKNPEMLVKWEECGQPKVVVKADDEDTLFRLEKEARNVGLITSIIRDAGRTQIARGSRTVLGIGPGPVSVVDKISGQLKLY